MNTEELSPSDLWMIAEQLSDQKTAATFFQSFGNSVLQQEIGEMHAKAILKTALRTLMMATRDNPTEGEAIIVSLLLPICLEKPSPIDDRFVGADRLRDHLADWIEQYPDEYRIPLRRRILSATIGPKRTQSASPVLWTVLAIGLRSPDIEAFLVRLARRKGETGEVAINCLAALSPDKDLRRRLIDKILRRRGEHRTNRLSLAIQELADPKFISLLTHTRKDTNADAFEELRFTSLLGRIADRSPGNLRVQKRVLGALTKPSHPLQELNTSVLSGVALPACNTRAVIPALVSFLTSPAVNFGMVFSRIQECVRPEQLKGWQEVKAAGLKTTLTKLAILQGSPNRSATIESHLRKLAWEAALSSGLTDVADWLAAILNHEASDRSSQDILALAGCLRLHTLPSAIKSLIREQIDFGDGSDATLLTRINAIQIARAACSRESFVVLLECGLTIKGAPLRATANAVGDVASIVAKDEPEFVLGRLFAACEEPERLGRRMLAIVGLQRLAFYNQIPEEYLARLIEIARDSTLPRYATAAAIWVVGSFRAAANAPEFIQFVRDQLNGPQEDQDIRFQSAQALLRLGLSGMYESEMFPALGLGESDGAPFKNDEPLQGWQAQMIGRLLVQQPQRFLAVGKRVLGIGNGATVHMFLSALWDLREKSEEHAIDIGKAAIERTRRVLGRSFGETDNFVLISDLSPREFLAEQWNTVWNDWMPSVRAALAEAVSGALPLLRDGIKIIALDLLEALLADSTYQVRRAAARSYSQIDSVRLIQLCQRWIRTGQTDLRLRCAEIAQWLPISNRDEVDNEITIALQVDPEPSVRKACADSRRDLRYHSWSSTLFEQICAGDKNDGNQWIAGAYALGKALVILGDDQTIHDVNSLSFHQDVPPNVQNWLRILKKEIDSRWRETTQKWPDPWVPWAGQLEECDATIIVGNSRIALKLSLWYRRQVEQSDIASWGGAFFAPSSVDVLSTLFTGTAEPLSLLIDEREEARIWVNAANIDGYVSFVGTGRYPAAVEI